MQTLGMNPPALPAPGSFSHDRRRRPRHKIHAPAYARISGDTDKFLLDLNTILDLSEDGMCIQGPAALGIDNVLNLCLELSDASGPIYTAGRVVWSNRLGRTGIIFRELSESSSQQLKRWLFLNAISGVADSRAKPAQDAQTPDVSAAEPAVLTPTDAVTLPQVSEPPAIPDHTSILAALSAVKHEAESLGTNLNAVLQLVAERAFSFTRASGAAVALSNGMEIVCRASAGSDVPSVGARVSTESGFSALCIQNGELLVCDDAENDDRVDRDACRSLGISSIIAVPIFQESNAVGLLEVFSREAHSFDGDAKLVLADLAETVAAALGRTSYAQRRSQQVPLPPTELEMFSTMQEPDGPHATSWFRRTLLALALLTALGAIVWVLFAHASSKNSPPATPAATSTTAAPATFDDERKMAEQGDAVLQFRLGVRYATGDEVAQDYTTAARWFSMAAVQGNVSAQSTLAAYYLSGTGVPKDYSKAYFWALLAQAGGDQASQYRVQLLASRIPHQQLITIQDQANTWLKDHHSTGTAP